MSETGGRADQLLGIPSQQHELKTRIASTIASNISPTPPYEIRDVAFPDGSGRHLCIVRVRKGNSVYLITKKGVEPVYIRNEDQSISADAARLQSLLATRLPRGHLPAEAALTQPAVGERDLYVTTAKQNDAQGPRVRSETFLLMRLIPEEPLPVRLDLPIEQRLLSIIRDTYPQLAGNVDDRDGNLGASLEEFRLRDWYRITYCETFRDYEIKWAIDSGSALYFVTQVRCKVQHQGSPTEVWSLCDVMTNLDCTIEVAHRLWDYLNYPGEARLIAELRVEQLPLLEKGGLESVYASAFDERDGSRRRARPLATGALSGRQRQNMRSVVAGNLTYATLNGSHAEPVSLVTNQFLRDLGYAASLADLRALV